MLCRKLLKRIFALTIIPALLCAFFTARGPALLADNEERDGSGWTYNSSLVNGALTGDAGYYHLKAGGEECLILPGRDGIYILENNMLKTFIKTEDVVLEAEVIPDADGDGFDDIAAVVRSEFFPAVRAYSSSSGKIIWSYKRALHYYESARKKSVEINNAIFDLTVIRASRAADSQLLLVSNYDIVSLSVSKGEKLWEYNDRDNVWKIFPVADINGNGSADIIFGNQLGELKALDGKNGQLLWKNKLVEDFAIESRYRGSASVSRSVWDITAKGGGEDNHVLVSAEDGYLYEIDIRNGKVVRETDVCKYTWEYLNQIYENQMNIYGSGFAPTGVFHKTFFGLKIFPVADVNGDGAEDFILTQNVGHFKSSEFTYNQYRMENPDIIRKNVYLVNGKNLDVLWSTDITDLLLNVDYTEPIVKDIEGSGRQVFFPAIFENGQVNFIALNLEDGRLNPEAEFTLSFQALYKVGTFKYIIRPSEKGHIFLGIMDVHSAVLNSDLDQLLVQFSAGSYEQFRKADNNILRMQLQGDIIKRLSMLDGSSQELIWEYGLEDTGLSDAMQLDDITLVEDCNNDGASDIVLKVIHSSMKTPGQIYKIISGKDGSQLYSIELPVSNASVYMLGDINGDKIMDFLVLEAVECYRLVSQLAGGHVDYQRDNKVIEYEMESLNASNARTIGDIDGDGVQDFYLGFMGNGTPYVSIISGKSMEKFYDIKDYYEYFYYFSNLDFNQDGVPDYIRHSNLTGEIFVMDGRTQQVALYIQLFDEIYNRTYDFRKPVFPGEYPGMALFNGSSGSYFVPVGDVTGDGKTDYAAVIQTYKNYRNLTQVVLFDIANGNSNPLRSYIIPADIKWDISYEYGILPLQKVNSGDQGQYLLFWHNGEYYLFDLEKWDLLMSFVAGNVFDAEVENGELAVAGSILGKMNISTDFSVLNLKAGDVAVSPINIKWKSSSNGHFSLTKVFVDGIFDTMTESDELTLSMRQGKHNILLKHTLDSGVSYYSSLELDVRKSSLPVFFLYFMALAAVAFLALMVVLPVARMKGVLKRRVRSHDGPGNIG